MGVVTVITFRRVGCCLVAVSAYMGVVTQLTLQKDLLCAVAVSAYMGVVTEGVYQAVSRAMLQSPPTWEL